MRGFGISLIVIGVAYLLVAFNMDVTVSTSGTYVPGYGSVGGGSVANLELMSRRQNHIIVASLITLVGVVISLFSGHQNRPVTDLRENASETETAFDGERGLASDSYRLWLARTYNITRNEVFDRFVIGDATFPTLDDALSHAHAIEQAKMDEAEARAEHIRLIREQRQAEEKLAAELAEAEWENTRPKLIAGAMLAIVAIVAIIYFGRETPEELNARLAKEKAAHAELLISVEKRFGIKIPNDSDSIIINENASEYSFVCNESKNGTLLTFKTRWSHEHIRDEFAKQLGKGSAQYELLPEKFDWRWESKGKNYELTMFDEEPFSKVYLCLTDIAS